MSSINDSPCLQIEFFLNGRTKGEAFRDVYEGAYFPAVSMFHDAVVRVNFGPKFRYALPRNAQPMSSRPEQLAVEQTLADLCDSVKIRAEEEQRLRQQPTAPSSTAQQQQTTAAPTAAELAPNSATAAAEDSPVKMEVSA